MFTPTTKEEAAALGWNELDIILITGDVYIDVPNDGTALIAKYLITHGYKVGIISQPDINSSEDISRLGSPRLFWSVSAGCVDSMVANYTSLNKPRRNDDLTPGGINNLRPDRATIIYTNLIKKYFKSTRPILLGGIEASLRRITHYDYWSDTVRRSVLCDSKADALAYGMAEKTVLEFAHAVETNSDFGNIRGLCVMASEPKKDYIMLPSYEECKADKSKFADMFKVFYKNNDPETAAGLCQQTGSRFWIQNPPQPYPTTAELDDIYSMKFERNAPEFYRRKGEIRALETVRYSVTSHRGCFGECSFCAIAVHEGRRIVSRTKESILSELREIASLKGFNGVISDIGGATANMFEMNCSLDVKRGVCPNKSCLYPVPCKNLHISHKPVIDLLAEARKIPGIKHIFIASGIRFDLIMADREYGKKYLEDIIKYHISGQMKIAPEHIDDGVLALMRKPGNANLAQFIELFKDTCRQCNKNYFLTYYFIAAHPGSTQSATKNLKSFINKELSFTPEQIQVFTPTPSTYSTLEYWTETDPFTGNAVSVEKKMGAKAREKEFLQSKGFNNRSSKSEESKKKGAGRENRNFRRKF